MSECTICIETFSLLEDLAVVPCGHCFHILCIKQWAQTPKAEGPSCPICQAKFTLAALKKVYVTGLSLVKTQNVNDLRESEQRLAEERERWARDLRLSEFREQRNEDLVHRVTEEWKDERQKKEDALAQSVTVLTELSQKEAELEVAEWEKKELAEEMEVLREETAARMEKQQKDSADRMEEQRKAMEARIEEREKGMATQMVNMSTELVFRSQEINRRDELLTESAARLEEMQLRTEKGEREIPKLIARLAEERRQKEEVFRHVDQFRDEVAIYRKRCESEEDMFDQLRNFFEEEEKSLLSKLTESESRCDAVTRELELTKDRIRALASSLDVCGRECVTAGSGKHLAADPSIEMDKTPLTADRSRTPAKIEDADADFSIESEKVSAGFDSDDKFEGVSFSSFAERPTLPPSNSKRIRDAAFLAEMGEELSVDFDSALRRSPDCLPDLIKELKDPRTSSRLTSALDSAAGILSDARGAPHFNFFARSVIEQVGPSLDQILRRFPVVDFAEENARVDAFCSGLRLTAHLMLARREHVDALLRRIELAPILADHLPFAVESSFLCVVDAEECFAGIMRFLFTVFRNRLMFLEPCTVFTVLYCTV